MRLLSILIASLLLIVPGAVATTVNLQFNGTLSATDRGVSAGMQTDFSLPESERQELISHSVESDQVQRSTYEDGSLTLVWEPGTEMPLQFTFSARYRTSPVMPMSSAGHASEYREYGPYIDTSESIERTARKLYEASERDNVTSIYAILQWIEREIEIDSGAPMRASAVMDEREASPDGVHALAASLMRAQDIAVRVAYGLIGNGGSIHPGHWLEAHIDKEWYGVDPIRFQMGILDSSHIALNRSARMHRSFAHTSGEQGSVETESSDFTVTGDVSMSGAPTLPVQMEAEPFVDTMVPGSYNVLEIELNNTLPVAVVSCLTPQASGLRFLDNKSCFYLPPQEEISDHMRFTSEARDHVKIHIGESTDPYLREELNETVSVYEDGENHSLEDITSLVERDVHIIQKRDVSAEEAEAVFDEHYNESASSEMGEQYNKTKDAMKLRKYSTRERNVTNIHIDLIPHNNMTNVSIYEKIPKCLAEEIDDILEASRDYRIVEEDPLIMWQIENIDHTVSLSYGVIKELRETGCQDQSLTLSVAHKIGESLEGNTREQSSPLMLYAIGGGGFLCIILILILLRRRNT